MGPVNLLRPPQSTMITGIVAFRKMWFVVLPESALVVRLREYAPISRRSIALKIRHRPKYSKRSSIIKLLITFFFTHSLKPQSIMIMYPIIIQMLLYVDYRPS